MDDFNILLCPVLPKRSDNLSDFQRLFNARIMGLLEETRQNDLHAFIQKGDQFLSSVRSSAVFNENGICYITLAKLEKLLRTSPQSVIDMLPLETLRNLSKISDHCGSIDVVLIEKLYNLYIQCERLYINLLPYSENNREISSYNLQEFIMDKYIPLMKNPPSTPHYYTAYATGIIFFLLDARRKSHVYLQDLLTSKLLIYLEECIADDNGELRDDLTINIFTLNSYQMTLQEFRSLDTDQDGVLSVSELLCFRYSYFNQVFIKRVFDISLTYEKGFLDFKGFIDLITAINFRHTKASAKYHFEAFDLKDDGYLDENEIREMCIMLQECFPREELPDIEVFQFEIMDMIQYNGRMSLLDFLSRKLRTLFTGVITNYNDWYRYERREQ